MDRRDFFKLTGALTVTLAVDRVWAQTNKVEVHWLGQAATKITSPSGKVIVIDPFLTKNPKTPAQWKNLDALGKVQFTRPGGGRRAAPLRGGRGGSDPGDPRGR